MKLKSSNFGNFGLGTYSAIVPAVFSRLAVILAGSGVVESIRSSMAKNIMTVNKPELRYEIILMAGRTERGDIRRNEWIAMAGSMPVEEDMLFGYHCIVTSEKIATRAFNGSPDYHNPLTVDSSVMPSARGSQNQNRDDANRINMNNGLHVTYRQAGLSILRLWGLGPPSRLGTSSDTTFGGQQSTGRLAPAHFAT